MYELVSKNIVYMVYSGQLKKVQNKQKYVKQKNIIGLLNVKVKLTLS
jgi:hypothetical protein